MPRGQTNSPQVESTRGPSGASSSWWRTLRRLNRKQWLYLPRLFSRNERLRMFTALIIAIIAFVVLMSRLSARFTVERPAVGGMLREGALTEPRFINPLYATNDTDRDLTRLVFSRLIRYDRSGAVAMDLAEAIDVADGGKTYTVTVKPGVVWHDGESFSVDDVIFTIKTIQNPEYASPLRQNWQGVSVEKVNDRTLRLTLRQPYAPFLENLSGGIIPEHLWRRIPPQGALLSDLNTKPVGTGPYRFSKFTRLEDGTITSVVLTRNARYYGEGPYLKEVRFSFYPDAAELLAAYRKNEIDSFVFSPGMQLDAPLLDSRRYELRVPKIFGIFLNATNQQSFSRQAVRKALSLAIDREEILGAASPSGGVIASGAIPPGTFGFNPDIAPTPYDPEAARRLLASDGWKDADRDGVLERTEGTGRNKTTQRLAVRLMTAESPELGVIAERVAAQWQAVGARAEVRTYPIQELESTVIRPRGYDALVFGEVFGHDPDPFAFWHTSQLKDPGLNIALYSNLAVDRILEEARRMADADRRALQYHEFQKIVDDEIGAIFLYSPNAVYAVRTTIRGITLGAISLLEERFDTASGWYTETRRAFR